jgi:hypothetical protein
MALFSIPRFVFADVFCLTGKQDKGGKQITLSTERPSRGNRNCADGVRLERQPLAPAGASGVQGDKGATGSSDPKGSTGVSGAQGHQGLQGLIGATGPTGDQGADGTKGSTGATGPYGKPTITFSTTFSADDSNSPVFASLSENRVSTAETDVALPIPAFYRLFDSLSCSLQVHAEAPAEGQSFRVMLNGAASNLGCSLGESSQSCTSTDSLTQIDEFDIVIPKNNVT